MLLVKERERLVAYGKIDHQRRQRVLAETSVSITETKDSSPLRLAEWIILRRKWTTF